MSTRTDKVASQIQAICATELERRHHNRHQLLTVTAVTVTPDLRSAMVFISFINVATTEAQPILEELQPQLQAAVAAQLKSKFTPKLQLQPDSAGEYAAQIERKLRELD